MTDVEIYRHQAAVVRRVVRTNTAGVTHAESLRAPEPGGNCLNWVIGHLVQTYEQLLPLLRQPPVLGVEAVQRYRRGSAPVNGGEDILQFDALLDAFDELTKRVDAGLAALTPAQLAAAPPISGFGDSVAELLSFVLFHQAYHSGQTGVLRRLLGREGAIP